jgi:hypothetical protein
VCFVPGIMRKVIFIALLSFTFQSCFEGIKRNTK